MLTLQDITKLIREPASKEIKLAREESTAYVRHVFGLGTMEYLTQLDEWENDKQAQARDEYGVQAEEQPGQALQHRGQRHEHRVAGLRGHEERPGREGDPVARYAPQETPAQIRADIEKVLG